MYLIRRFVLQGHYLGFCIKTPDCCSSSAFLRCACTTIDKLRVLKFHLCVPLNNYKVFIATGSSSPKPTMVTMADMALRDPGIELTPRISVAAAEYAEYKALRDQFKQGVLGELALAVRTSTVAALDGLSYPVKFRNQGALDEWRRLLTAYDWSQRMWDQWAKAPSTCIDCINELCLQVDQPVDPNSRRQRAPGWSEAAFTAAVKWAANIHFERKCCALIETTPALDTLLMHSDIGDTLPMDLFSPPFNAQYLRLHRDTAEHFKAAEDHASQRWIDSIFCFVSKPSSLINKNNLVTVIELVTIYGTNDKGISAQLLRGTLIAPDETATQWADAILMSQGGQRAPDDNGLMKLINNMVKVFLHLGLTDARKELDTEYSVALKRSATVGPENQARLQRRLEPLYDRIVVGPVSTPAIPAVRSTADAQAPHWRRGHFRVQPCGPARSSRKLIFVAPILIHADRFGGQAPPPKLYELTAGRTRP
jgi:hypothetical protein